MLAVNHVENEVTIPYLSQHPPIISATAQNDNNI
jgi:hypothetical protein